jgi:hypothetical protein
VQMGSTHCASQASPARVPDPLGLSAQGQGLGELTPMALAGGAGRFQRDGGPGPVGKATWSTTERWGVCFEELGRSGTHRRGCPR